MFAKQTIKSHPTLSVLCGGLLVIFIVSCCEEKNKYCNKYKARFVPHHGMMTGVL